MTVWVGCGGCYTEIATAFSKPRNDESHNRNNSSIICNDSVWVLSLQAKRSNPQTTNCHPFVIANEVKQSTNHNSLTQKQKIKRIHYSCTPSSLRDFIEGVAIHKPQKVNIKIENKKKLLLFIKSKN